MSGGGEERVREWKRRVEGMTGYRVGTGRTLIHVGIFFLADDLDWFAVRGWELGGVIVVENFVVVGLFTVGDMDWVKRGIQVTPDCFARRGHRFDARAQPTAERSKRSAAP